MATPAEKLAESLNQLKKIQDKGAIAIKASALSRTHRERLLASGFIQAVYKGWYIAASPETPKGDSTSWYSNYWGFCVQFLRDRFGRNWCISPEQSMLLHAGSTTIPAQLIVRSPKANNSTSVLPQKTSFFFLRAGFPPAAELTENDGIQMFSLPGALVRASPNTYTQNEIDARTALSPCAGCLRDPCHTAGWRAQFNCSQDGRGCSQ